MLGINTDAKYLIPLMGIDGGNETNDDHDNTRSIEPTFT